MSYGLIDELSVSSVLQLSSDMKQHIDRRFHMPSPIPAKDELFEVAAQVRFADAVIGAERPALEVGEDAMLDPRQDHVRRHFAADLGLVVVALEAAIGGEAVAEDRHAFRPLQAGQMRPFGQRFSKRKRAQAASSGNRSLKAGRDIGRSCFQRLVMRTNLEHPTGASSGGDATYWMTGFKGIRSFRNSQFPP